MVSYDKKLEEIYGKYVDTKAQAADILTKAFNKAEDFQRVPKITQLTRRPTNTAAKNPTPAGGDSVLASQQSNKTRNRPRRIRKRWNRSRGEDRRTQDNTNICVDDYQCYSCTHTLITAPLARFAQDGSRGRVDSLPRSPCTDRLGRSQQSFSAIQSGKLLLDSMQIPGFQPKAKDSSHLLPTIGLKRLFHHRERGTLIKSNMRLMLMRRLHRTVVHPRLVTEQCGMITRRMLGISACAHLHWLIYS